MRFRFTLNNTTAGPLIISEPGGWDEAVLKLERNEEFHSLVEFYDLPATFYSSAFDYLTEIERSQGPDSQVNVLIELNDGTTWETISENLVDVVSLKQIDGYKSEGGLIRDSFWQKFINRKGTEIDLASTVDLDGGTRTNPGSYTLHLPSQKVRKEYSGISGSTVSYTSAPYGIIDFPLVPKDEITDRLISSPGSSTTQPKAMFTLTEAGDYTFDISIVTNSTGLFPGGSHVSFVDCYLNISGTATAMTATISGTDGVDGKTTFTYSGTQTLNVSDTISIYFRNSSGSGFYIPQFYQSHLTITADTTYTDTTADAWYLGDAAISIISKLVGRDSPVTSTFLNSSCAKFALSNGLHIRGYSVASKPFQMSFADWWNGVNPLINLGLGYTTISGTNYIEIEKRESFFDPVSVLNLDYVNKIERSYQTKDIFKNIEVGFAKWSAESSGGVDDPQTKHTYRTRFKTVGEDVSILSKFVGASLAIEQTRRNRAAQSNDWRLDNDVFIIALNKADRTIPEKAENFTSISGLMNSSTRYNSRLTPGYIFKRWAKYFSGCLKWYPGAVFSFSSGQGNCSMTSTLSASDCEGDGIALTEDQDITAGSFLYAPIVYEFEHPLTWNEYKAIRSNRKKAIGISRSNTGHVPCYIFNLEYSLTRGKAKFKVQPANEILQ